MSYSTHPALPDARRRALLDLLRQAGRVAVDAPLAGWRAADLARAVADLQAAAVARIVHDGTRIYVTRWSAGEHGSGRAR